MISFYVLHFMILTKYTQVHHPIKMGWKHQIAPSPNKDYQRAVNPLVRMSATWSEEFTYDTHIIPWSFFSVDRFWCALFNYFALSYGNYQEWPCYHNIASEASTEKTHLHNKILGHNTWEPPSAGNHYSKIW
jgi:hypothetical protein